MLIIIRLVVLGVRRGVWLKWIKRKGAKWKVLSVRNHWCYIAEVSLDTWSCWQTEMFCRVLRFVDDTRWYLGLCVSPCVIHKATSIFRRQLYTSCACPLSTLRRVASVLFLTLLQHCNTLAKKMRFFPQAASSLNRHLKLGFVQRNMIGMCVRACACLCVSLVLSTTALIMSMSLCAAVFHSTWVLSDEAHESCRLVPWCLSMSVDVSCPDSQGLPEETHWPVCLGHNSISLLVELSVAL